MGKVISISREAFVTLQSIVGVDWVSGAPAIYAADRFCTVGSYPPESVRPACSIQLASTEGVQGIV